MANPQREDGHIDIANEIVDKLCQYRIPGQEWQILWVILRKTWGWAVRDKNGNYVIDNAGSILKKKKDRIPLSQFSKLTGIPRTKCHNLLGSLVRKNLVKKYVPQKGYRNIVTYGFNKNYEEWKVSPKKAMFPKKVTKVSPKKVTSKEIKKERSQKILKKEYFELVDFLIEKMRENDPKAKVPNTKKRLEDWANDFRLLVEKDGRSVQEVREIVVWSQDDSFWGSNILSAGKLREQFPQLMLKKEAMHRSRKPDPAELTRKEMKH